MAKYLDYEGLKYFIGKIKTSISGKADKRHTHAIGDVSNLQSALNSKSNTGHTHTISNVSGLQNALNNKSSTGHSHSTATTTNSGFMSARDKKIVDNLIFDTNQQAVFKIIDGKPVLETTEV